MPSVTIDDEVLGAPGSSGWALRGAVEDFLFLDAELLDSWRLEEWLALCADDVYYYVPSTDRPDGDPANDLFLVQDDRFLLTQRVESLVSGTAWVEAPHSRLRHMVSNVRATHLGDGLVDVRANFVVYRSKGSTCDVYPGHYQMRLQRGGPAGFRILVRRAILDLEELRPHGRVGFIL